MTRTDWGDFYLVQHGLKRHTDDDVRAAEAVLGVQLPNGYRELMTTLGEGEINGILRVFPPAKLEGEQEFFRELTQDVWFFNEPDETLTQDHALESIAIADTNYGDQIIFHPGTGRLHVLPRHDEHTYSVGTDLWDVVTWYQESGVLTRPHTFRYFESFAGPTEATNGQAPRGSFSQLAEVISSLGVHDAVESGDDECTFFVKAIGGYLSLQDPQTTDINVHFRYQPDRAPDLRKQIHQTATTTGVTFGAPWSMSS